MACVPRPTSTVFSTITSTSLITDVGGFTTSLVFDPEARTISTVLTSRTVAGQVVTFPVRSIVTGATVPTRVPVETTRTSLIVSSTPISTLFSTCESTTTTTTSTTTIPTTTTTTTTSSTTTTTSSTTTTTTPTPSSSSTTTTTTTTSSNTPSQSTITEFTTVPRTSSTSSATSATLASNRPGSGSSSGSNTGAIAGGVVGGIAGLAILAALIFFCCKKKRNDKEFDFGDDTWDPAGAAYGSSSNMRQHSTGSVLRSSRYSTGSGVGAGAAAGAAAGAGAAALTRGGGGSRTSPRRNRPADEQDNYYSAVGIPSRDNTATPMSSTTFNTTAFGAGMAGVGAASRQQPHDPLYGGLANEQSGRNEGGWGVANRMRDSQQYGPSSPDRRSAGPGIGGISTRVPPPTVSSGLNTMPSIPYRLPSPDAGAPLSPPASLMAGGGGANGFPGPIASPAPSHRSIPGMGGMAWAPGLSGHASDDRRSGQLRVMNEEPEPQEEERLDKDSSVGSSEDKDRDYLSGADEEAQRRAEEERRFGTRNGDAYDGLTEGLGRNASVNGSQAPSYRTY
ncbi:hypothetical protein OIV83_000387 [Microbotryomycetes sp. JL201]|nr:hypothetical protein OIV83_000387 [Microbotryomycetes sp. JL201]